MSIKDVTAMRRSGRLDEAYSLATQDLKKEENEWTRMSLFWVLKDLCIKKLESGDSNGVLLILDRMRLLLPFMKDTMGVAKVAYGKIVKQLLPQYITIKNAVELSKSNPLESYDQITKTIGKKGTELDPRLHEDFGWIIYRYLNARISDLTSNEVNDLLKDYLNLQNERPSLLHSMILNFALNYTKVHSEFVFQDFFIQWGINNLRNEDLNSIGIDGKEIPSLLARICKYYVVKGIKVNFIALSDFIDLPVSQIADMVRQPYFWFLFNHKKEDEFAELEKKFIQYTDLYAQNCSSKWHTEILKLATDYYSSQNRPKDYITFVKKWDINNFLDSDWTPEKGKDGNDYPGTAVKVLKICFEITKNNQNNVTGSDHLLWLASFFDIALTKVSDDESLERQRALISIWSGQTEDAINRYKNLLSKNACKYYLWFELSKCVTDDKLKSGLLLKALSIEVNEDFIGEIRLDLAEVLLKLGYHKQAQKNLEVYIKHKHLQGRRAAGRFDSISKKCNFTTVSEIRPFEAKEFIASAEEFVFSQFK